MRDADQVVLASGLRTPFGRFGGSLTGITSLELAKLVVGKLVEQHQLDPEAIDGVVLGHVFEDHPQAVYMAKYAAMAAGARPTVTGLIVNRLCGSGLQAIATAAQEIMFDQGSVYIAGGAECMSNIPYQLPGARDGWGLGQGHLVDPLSDERGAMVDPSCGMVMGATGDEVAERYGITRDEADDWAFRSHQRVLKANRDGLFSADVVPVEGVLDHDEHARDSSREDLSRLVPIFREDGVCTAGNSSGLNDGAAAILVLAAERADELGVTPRARLVSWAIAGCDPDVMGIAPVASTRLALERAGLSLHDIDVIEINEAFAAQVLAVGRELAWDDEQVNPHGGAIGLGHPVGVSGTRLVIQLMRELVDTGGQYGLATACIGGGQGISLIIEQIS